MGGLFAVFIACYLYIKTYLEIETSSFIWNAFSADFVNFVDNLFLYDYFK